LAVVVAIRPPLGAIVQTEGGVVVGQAAQLDLALVPTIGSTDLGSVVAQLGGGGQVPGVADCLVAGPAARMVGDQPPVTECLDSVQVGADLDAAADDCRVDRVVVAVQAHVVVTRQPQRAAPPGHRSNGWEGQHRRPVSADPVGRGTAQHPPRPLVDQPEPVAKLGVEVSRRGEAAAGQERGLQIAIGPLDQPLGLRIARVADQHLGA
jgi:hypothetical protein